MKFQGYGALPASRTGSHNRYMYMCAVFPQPNSSTLEFSTPEG